jgi:hypothetical protein
MDIDCGVDLEVAFRIAQQRGDKDREGRYRSFAALMAKDEA